MDGQRIPDDILSWICISAASNIKRGNMIESSTMLQQEDLRIRAVRNYAVPGSPKSLYFDRITRLVAATLDVPIAIISFVDENKIWFKSAYGLELKQLPLDPGLCTSAICSDQLYLVENALSDQRTNLHPLVKGQFALRFYAALPLKTLDGYLIGTLCLMDKQPRTLDEHQLLIFQDFKDTVTDLLELEFACKNAVAQQRQMLNMAVHDLKNPLANISIRAQLIERKKDDLKAVSAMALQIRETSQQIITQVSDLLNSEREVLDRVLHYKKIDLEMVVRRVSEGSAVLADYKEQQLLLSVRAHPIVMGDELQLTEIIDNLVSNAIKYCFTGGKIDISLSQSGNVALLSVCDNGPGFTEEDHRKMFQRFARLSAKPTGQESSSGLGLSIVQQLVEQHGGKVYATMMPKGSGAQMTVELPII